MNRSNSALPAQPDLDPTVPTITVDGLTFRDLDHDGELGPYEDWRRPVAERVADLLSRMTLEEKVGTMLHGTLRADEGPLAVLGRGERYDLDDVAGLIGDRHVTSMITRLIPAPGPFAEQNNLVQRIAAKARLGIPVTISSDPRHHFGDLVGATVSGTGFTEWPETLGLGALDDVDLVRSFGDCVRREYRSVGIAMSLAPQADLATNPRWPRFSGSFGEDPALVDRMVGAYVEGVQAGADGLGPTSVACVVKHWVGYGATSNGFDGHNFYGRHAAFPSDAFDDHVAAFSRAFANGVAGVMPTYSILQDLELEGVPVEQVGAGFNRQLLQDLLRRDHGFGGMVLSDWAITRDCNDACRTGEPSQEAADIAMCWGVEDLSRVERFAACINAGVDQIGGEEDPAPLLEAVRSGRISEARIDDAVGSVLAHKFELGLFEQPFVDPEHATAVVGSPEARAEAADAQRRSLVALAGTATVPADAIVWAEGPLADELAARGVAMTDDVTAATFAVATTSTPHEELHPGFFFGRWQHEGDLDFKPGTPERDRLDALLGAVPTVLVVTMDRPPILTPFVDADSPSRAAAVVADLGASPAAVADVLTGATTAEGRMPFRLPATMEDAIASPCDRPSDDLAPLFPTGTGTFAD